MGPHMTKKATITPPHMSRTPPTAISAINSPLDTFPVYAIQRPKKSFAGIAVQAY
jgi:hypothetical protein